MFDSDRNNVVMVTYSSFITASNWRFIRLNGAFKKYACQPPSLTDGTDWLLFIAFFFYVSFVCLFVWFLFCHFNMLNNASSTIQLTNISNTFSMKWARGRERERFNIRCGVKIRFRHTHIWFAQFISYPSGTHWNAINNRNEMKIEICVSGNAKTMT